MSFNNVVTVCTWHVYTLMMATCDVLFVLLLLLYASLFYVDVIKFDGCIGCKLISMSFNNVVTVCTWHVYA